MMLQERRPTNVARASRFAYIDALRGYAILGVIGVHASQLFPSLEWPVRLVADQGVRGVQLFFTVSALTLMMSWQSRADGLLPFWTRRVFRVGPMFWLAVAYYVTIVGWFHVGLRYWGPTEISWSDALASAALMHGFHPVTMNSIVPGGWSIADEMGFYALFPLLVLTIRSWRAAGIALLMSIALVVALTLLVTGILPALSPTTSMALSADFGELFPFQLPAFLVGILVFHLLRTFSGRLSHGALRAGLFCALTLIAALPFLAAFLAGRIHWAIYFLVFGIPPFSYSIVFAVVAFCLAEGVGLFLVNAVIVHIGKVSYSAYFWHFAMLELIGLVVASFGWSLAPLGWSSYVATFALAVALSVAGATLTFLIVEQPMIRIGHRLAGALAKRRTLMASDRPAVVSPASE
jgi:peptidoglycan/LPS O-acetylase OafA/YrhL